VPASIVGLAQQEPSALVATGEFSAKCKQLVLCYAELWNIGTLEHWNSAFLFVSDLARLHVASKRVLLCVLARFIQAALCRCTCFRCRYWTTSEEAGFVRSCLPQRCLGGADLLCEVGYAGPFCSSVSILASCMPGILMIASSLCAINECISIMNVSR
jgi:hypothetical protein